MTNLSSALSQSWTITERPTADHSWRDLCSNRNSARPSSLAHTTWDSWPHENHAKTDQ